MYNIENTVKEVFKNIDEIENIKNCPPATYVKSTNIKDKKEIKETN